MVRGNDHLKQKFSMFSVQVPHRTHNLTKPDLQGVEV